jgi:hypothetical protein
MMGRGEKKGVDAVRVACVLHCYVTPMAKIIGFRGQVHYFIKAVWSAAAALIDGVAGGAGEFYR